MCGIAGLILSTGAPPPDPMVISRLIDSLHHRGPDGTGHAVVGLSLATINQGSAR